MIMTTNNPVDDLVQRYKVGHHFFASRRVRKEQALRDRLGMAYVPKLRAKYLCVHIQNLSTQRRLWTA